MRTLSSVCTSRRLCSVPAALHILLVVPQHIIRFGINRKPASLKGLVLLIKRPGLNIGLLDLAHPCLLAAIGGRVEAEGVGGAVLRGQHHVDPRIVAQLHLVVLQQLSVGQG